MSVPQTHQVKFTGDAKTYFGIWIVNVLLSIVTLGIYSAWAKVRTRRYFAQNTVIDERRFDYHATGLQIFLGRLIVVLGLIVLAIPLINLIAIIVLLIILPILLNRSLAFNARMTSFSGVRFSFEGSYGGAFLVFMLYPVLSAFTLYTTVPFVARAHRRYVIGQHRFGTAAFEFDSPIGPFYKAFLYAVGWGALVLIVAFFGLGGSGLLSMITTNAQSGAGPSPEIIGAVLVFYVAILLAILPAGFIYHAYLRNLTFNNTTLAGIHRFESDLSPLWLMWLALSNSVVVACTLGLMYPWARIRMTRYLADHTRIKAAGSLDGFVGQESQKVSAIGDAFTDIEGIELGIGI